MLLLARSRASLLKSKLIIWLLPFPMLIVRAFRTSCSRDPLFSSNSTSLGLLAFSHTYQRKREGKHIYILKNRFSFIILVIKLGVTFPYIFKFSVQLLSCVWLLATTDVRLPCTSPTPRACSDSCTLSWCCHPTISSCQPLLHCLQFFTASGSFPMNQFFSQVARVLELQHHSFQWIFRTDFL